MFWYENISTVQSQHPSTGREPTQLSVTNFHESFATVKVKRKRYFDGKLFVSIYLNILYDEFDEFHLIEKIQIFLGFIAFQIMQKIEKRKWLKIRKRGNCFCFPWAQSSAPRQEMRDYLLQTEPGPRLRHCYDTETEELANISHPTSFSLSSSNSELQEVTDGMLL